MTTLSEKINSSLKAAGYTREYTAKACHLVATKRDGNKIIAFDLPYSDRKAGARYVSPYDILQDGMVISTPYDGEATVHIGADRGDGFRTVTLTHGEQRQVINSVRGLEYFLGFGDNMLGI
jgi:hypothetical protein